ncbi:MAG: hypothetical protein Q7J51_05465 [Sheuella sp.]|nr:hypothetical protein [Sheuella sp.]
MTIFKPVPPIVTTSVGGFSVSIASVDPSQMTDQISGNITTTFGTSKATWNEAGKKRGGDPLSKEDLNMNLPELAYIKKLLK